MAQLNANTPYVQCYIRNNYIFGAEDNGLTEGYIFGVKSMINRPMHFHFQACFGAVFWQMPISAFCHKEDYDALSENEEKNDFLFYKHGIVRIMISQLQHSAFCKTAGLTYSAATEYGALVSMFLLLTTTRETLMNSILGTRTIRIQNATTFWNWMMETMPYLPIIFCAGIILTLLYRTLKMNPLK